MGIKSAPAEGAMNSLDAFNHYSRLLFGIAYRMLGTVTDAEDVGKFCGDRANTWPLNVLTSQFHLNSKSKSPHNFSLPQPRAICRDYWLS
jgi:hypothetical protein